MRVRILLLAVCLLGACDTKPNAPLVATDVIVYQSVPGSNMRAGYLTLTNNSNATITIDQVTSPEFGSVEMHETIVKDGIAKMRALPSLSISAGESAHFERGGKHLMLMQAGENVGAVTLQFHSGSSLLLSVIAVQNSAGD
jgi:copper(I)-binding protein